MHGWLLEIPLREKTFRSQCIFRLDRVGSAVFETFRILGVPKIETLHPTDPPR
jgi:hypothetical protein